MYNGKRILVTGGAGFVGSNLVLALAKRQAKVTVIDDLFTGDPDLWEDYREHITFFHDSVNNAELVDELVSDADVIFHLAARNITASMRNPIEDYRTNIGGTLNIMLSSVKYPVRKIVYTSSASVYGNPRYLPINEDDCINLLTPYAVSKYAGEGYCMAFYESYKLPVTVLRLSNVYGPRQSPMNPYCGVVAKFMDRGKIGFSVEIHGDGQSTRDFTYVEDVVDALLLAGMSENVDGEVLNVATGIETSINDLADIISHLYPNKSRKDQGDIYLQPSHINRRDIDNIRRRVLNIEKIRRRLGWMPTVSLKDGLFLTKKWMDANG